LTFNEECLPSKRKISQKISNLKKLKKGKKEVITWLRLSALI
jgi:hypothetical protein